MRTIRRIASILLLVAVVSPAGAAWLPDGSPVGTGAGGYRVLRAVVADGSAALFVAWDWGTGPYRQVRVQRLLSNGDLAPGWPASGVAPTAPMSIQRENPYVSPDGLGGCHVAWNELDQFYYYVRVQHVLASGLPDPAWPAAGALVAQGSGRFFGTYQQVSVAGLVPDAGGGCRVLVQSQWGGCHDGFCVDGGETSLRTASTTGVLSPAVILESCSTYTSGIGIPDGTGGLYALTQTNCPNQIRFRHTIAGSEPPVPLPIPGTPLGSRLGRAADGSVLAVVWNNFGSSPVWFHWNADGSPAAGAPATGVVMPAGGWSFAPDAAGTSAFVWQPGGSASPLYARRLESDGSSSPGWPMEGLSVASAPAQAEVFAACSDGAGGVVTVWQDRRVPDRDLYVTRRFANGAPAAGVPPSGVPLCTSAGNALNPRVVTLAPGVSIAVWEDFRAGGDAEIFAQRITLDTPVAATASFAGAEAFPDRVRLEWRFTEPVPEVVLDRSHDGNEWVELARLVPGSLGSVTYEDSDVRSGESLAYRIHFRSGEQQVWTVPVWVEIPRAELALRLVPPTTRDRLSLEITLVSDEPARLDLVDVLGRKLQSHDLGRLGTDPARLELELDGVASGIAWLRLQQGKEKRTLRLAIVR